MEQESTEIVFIDRFVSRFCVGDTSSTDQGRLCGHLGILLAMDGNGSSKRKAEAQ